MSSLESISIPVSNEIFMSVLKLKVSMYPLLEISPNSKIRIKTISEDSIPFMHNGNTNNKNIIPLPSAALFPNLFETVLKKKKDERARRSICMNKTVLNINSFEWFVNPDINITAYCHIGWNPLVLLIPSKVVPKPLLKLSAIFR